MEVRDLALKIVTTESLEEKLAAPPAELTDHEPGRALRIEKPGRPPALGIVSAAEARVPALGGMGDPSQRPHILHAMANHELQAAELFAWALLAFPETPPEFRLGLLGILADEQRHCRMYLARLKDLGARPGDYPVSGYFWNKVGDLTTPVRFVCAMGLTFENANLDHTVDYAEAARETGDAKTAAVIDLVYREEIEHVRFGWYWLGRFKEEGQSMCGVYLANITWPLRPALARGRIFHPRGRQAAGLDAEFLRLLAAAEERDRAQKE